MKAAFVQEIRGEGAIAREVPVEGELPALNLHTAVMSFNTGNESIWRASAALSPDSFRTRELTITPMCKEAGCFTMPHAAQEHTL
jgi:hypothetical protein